MSYDLRLVRVGPGETAEEVAMRDVEEAAFGPLDPQKEAMKKRVAEALIAADKGLKPFAFDYKKTAKLLKISVEQARYRMRHIELNDEAAGIQIMLFDDEAGVTVPYWHAGEKAKAVFARMLEHVRIIARESGFVGFDPQTEQVIDPDADLELMVGTYTPMVRRLHEENAPRSGKRPWWKLW